MSVVPLIKPVKMGAEWVANSSACRTVCADALSTFSLDLVGIVVEYLKLPDASVRVYGLKELHVAYGKMALEVAACGPVHELPMPLEIEALLQKDLADVFCPEMRAGWAPKQKMAEVFSLYFKPANISPRKTEMMAKRSGLQFCDDAHHKVALRAHGDVMDSRACWILFPDERPKLSMPFAEQIALLPPGFRFAGFGDTSFCLFAKHAAKTRANGDGRGVRSPVQRICCADRFTEPNYCIAPMLKIFADPSLKSRGNL